MEKLATDYTVEVDCVDRDTWCGIQQKFDDANIYQTWSYGAIRWGQDNLSHLVLKKNGETVAAAQVRIFKIPLINIGIAYIRSGPLWRLHGYEVNLEIFRQTIRALREEYVIRRHLILRILPKIIDEDADDFHLILKNEGFKLQSTVRPYRTLWIDLRHSLEDLRKGLRQSWRKNLVRSEKNELEIIEGTNVDLIDNFLEIYEEMVSRKKFISSVNMYDYRTIQENLNSSEKLIIMVCNYNGKAVATVGFSALGDTGIDILAATGKDGLDLKASYLLRWRQIEWLKQHDIKWFDFGGINPDRNPGGYFFKSGLSGKNGKDVHFLGQFDACENKVSLFVIKSTDKVREIYRRIKVRVFK